MLQLLQPVWLYAIGGIIVPLIIHLWNIREGKTLQVGSILLLQESAKHQARSLRLKNILLLILRCLLIITLAFLLAKPAWKKQLTAGDEKGWVILQKDGFQETYEHYKPVIDSLAKAGYKFHYFNGNFEPAKLSDTATISGDTAKINYWALLKKLGEEVPTGLSLYLFTDNHLKHFTGTRPAISLNLKWYTYTAVDTKPPFVIKAYETSTDSFRLIMANSKQNATFYTFKNLPRNSTVPDQSFNAKEQLADSSITNPAPYSGKVDTAAMNIIIYADQFSVDAQYVKAALEAIRQFTALKIKVSFFTDAAAINPANNWLFWLSEKTLPLTGLPPNVFVYENGKKQAVNSWITAGNDAAVNGKAIHLSQLIENNNTTTSFAQPVWNDGFGHAVLSLEKGNNLIYHFYSRFDPEWNDLPWSGDLAEMIFKLLVKPENKINDFDQRIISDAQLQPDKGEGGAVSKKQLVKTINLDKFFWIITFIIFCIERFISLTINKAGMYA